MVLWCVNEEARLMPVMFAIAIASTNGQSLLLINSNSYVNALIKILTSWKFGEPSRITFQTSKICHIRPLLVKSHTKLLPDVTIFECSTRDSQCNSKTSKCEILKSIFNLNYITKCTTCAPVQPSQPIYNWCNAVEYGSSLGWH